VEPLVPSEGWGVLHLFYKVDHARAEAEPGGAKRVVDAVASLEADGHQALVFAVLGHKAELGVMALGPDVARLQAFQQELTAAPLSLEWSYVSLTERSEYTDDEERARQRLYPTLPRKRAICFYPMSKRREP
jgi:chlorite dismutase